MNTRQAKKILKRWSRDFSRFDAPRDMHAAGRMPWPWGTWVEAHRVWLRACTRRFRR